jgi:NAD(P)H-dependent FMN reductase
MMPTMATLKIGIIIGSTREGRVSPQVAAWVKEQAQAFNKNNYDKKDLIRSFLLVWGHTIDRTLF